MQIHAHVLDKKVFKNLQRDRQNMHMRKRTCLVLATLLLPAPVAACGPGREQRITPFQVCGVPRRLLSQRHSIMHTVSTKFNYAISGRRVCRRMHSLPLPCRLRGWNEDNRHAVCTVCEAGLENLAGHRRTRCATPKWGTLNAYEHPNFHNLDNTLLNIQNSLKLDSVSGAIAMPQDGYRSETTEGWNVLDPYQISLNTYRQIGADFERIEYDEAERPCDFIKLWKTSFLDFPEGEALGMDHRLYSFCSQNILRDSLYAHVLPVHTKRKDIFAYGALLKKTKTKRRRLCVWIKCLLVCGRPCNTMTCASSLQKNTWIFYVKISTAWSLHTSRIA